MMKMRTRNPAASTDIGSVIQSETARHMYIAAQVAKTRRTTSRAVRGCTPISAPENPWFQKVSGPLAALPDPPPAEMNPPANRVAHRHRPAAAGTEIALLDGRRGEFTRSKIAVGDLVVGVVRDAAADCALRADDLLAFACDQHVRLPCCRRFTARSIKPSAAERPGCSPRRPTELGSAGGGRRRNAGSEPAAAVPGAERRRWQAAGGLATGRLGRSR